MFVGINHVTIVVKDKSEAENFYFNLLGLEKLNVGKSLWARVGDQFIHINENLDINFSLSFRHFAIEVENLIPYLTDLINRGVEVFDLQNNIEKVNINSDLENKNRNFFVEDPSGNFIEFFDSSNNFFKQ